MIVCTFCDHSSSALHGLVKMSGVRKRTRREFRLSIQSVLRSWPTPWTSKRIRTIQHSQELDVSSNKKTLKWFRHYVVLHAVVSKMGPSALFLAQSLYISITTLLPVVLYCVFLELILYLHLLLVLFCYVPHFFVKRTAWYGHSFMHLPTFGFPSSVFRFLSCSFIWHGSSISTRMLRLQSEIK